MTIRHLRIFAAVYQNMSITKAADQLHLAQPSVSLAISELEKYYGIRLFDRMSRRLHATEVGNKFYGYALHIVSMFDDMEKNVRDWDLSAALRIGSSVTIGNCILPPLVRRFNRNYPDIQVTVSINNSATLEQKLADNSIDFALVEGLPSSSALVQIPFMDDRLCLILSPDHPLAKQDKVRLEDLKSYPLLLREQGSAGRDILESIAAYHQIPLSPSWESISTQSIINAAAQGLGISVLPNLLVKNALQEGVIIEKPLKDASLSRKFSIIYHQNKYLTRSAVNFIELCRQSADLSSAAQ